MWDISQYHNMKEFYKNNWKGSFDGSDEELEKLLEFSADTVNNTIFLSGYKVDTVPDIFSENVKKAVCSQADFINNNGGIEALSCNQIQSATVGKFSYTASSSSENSSLSELCSQAVSYLIPTGLLYRGI